MRANRIESEENRKDPLMTKTRRKQILSSKHNVAEGIYPNNDLSDQPTVHGDEREKDPIARIVHLVTAAFTGVSSKKKRKIREILRTLSADSNTEDMKVTHRKRKTGRKTNQNFDRHETFHYKKCHPRMLIMKTIVQCIMTRNFSRLSNHTILLAQREDGF